MKVKEKVILYGSSAMFNHSYHGLKAVYDIVGVSDSFPNRKGIIENLGEKYIAPKDIAGYEFDKIIIMSSYYKEIFFTLVHHFNIDRSKIRPITDFALEQEFSPGELNPDRTFYVYRNADAMYQNPGMFTFVYMLLQTIDFLRDKNYEIFVDFQNYSSIFLEDSKIGKENVWEYFFKQPCGETCETVYNSKNVVLGIGGYVDWSKVILPTDEGALAFDFSPYGERLKKYLVLSDDMQKRVDDEYNRIFRPLKEKGKKICGVLYRGSDYTKLKYYRHPVQPTIEQAIEKTRQLKSEWGFDYIYFDSEDNKALKAFCEAFPDDVIYSERARVDEYIYDEMVDVRFDRENDKYLKAMEYIRSCYLMARCDFFISAHFGGSGAVMNITDGFEQSYIFSLGFYGVDDDSFYWTPNGRPVYVKKDGKKST